MTKTTTTFNKAAVETLARQLLDQHHLTAWTFAWDKAKTRMGCCKYQAKQITLSLPNAQLNPQEVSIDTVKHEIAHALTPGKGHGRLWKLKAMELGCSIMRCAGSDTETVQGNYRAKCHACGKEFNQHRLPKRTYYCPCYRRAGYNHCLSALHFLHKDEASKTARIAQRLLLVPSETVGDLPANIQPVDLTRATFLPPHIVEEPEYATWLQREMIQHESAVSTEMRKLAETVKTNVLAIFHPSASRAKTFQQALVGLASGQVKIKTPLQSITDTFSNTPFRGVQRSLFEL